MHFQGPVGVANDSANSFDFEKLESRFVHPPSCCFYDFPSEYNISSASPQFGRKTD